MSVDNQVEEPVDIFGMSSDEFANFDLSTDNPSDEESTDVDSSTDVDAVDESLEVEDNNPEEDEYIDVEGADDELDDTEEETEQEDVSEEDEESEESDEPSEEDTLDYEAEFKKLIGNPIKAAGKEITVGSVDEAQKLMQLGAGYYKNMEALKPARKIIAMLEQNELMDEEKLNFAIDLLNKNPQAINKLISDQDLSEIVDEKNADYTPNNHGVSEQQLNVNEALKEIEDTDTYSRTVNVLGSTWDGDSRKIVQNNPQVIGMINDHIASGVFDTVTAEVERRKMFGSIPAGTPDIIAYKQVGDELYANATNQNAPDGQHIDALKANAPKPAIRKPNAVVKKNKLAAGKPRGKATVTEQFEDVFAMSSDEFKRKFG